MLPAPKATGHMSQQSSASAGLRLFAALLGVAHAHGNEYSWAAWVGGSRSANQNGVYGSSGVASASNMPGGREGATSWVDTSSRRVYVFGGSGRDSGSASDGALNCLWAWDMDAAAGEGWIWIGGSNSANQNGVYGSMGVVSASNMPGSRYNAASWVDTSLRRAYVFGGEGYDESPDSIGQLNW